jgi:hypothetical protein
VVRMVEEGVLGERDFGVRWEWGGVGLLGKRWNLKFVTVLASWKPGVR